MPEEVCLHGALGWNRPHLTSARVAISVPYTWYYVSATTRGFYVVILIGDFEGVNERRNSSFFVELNTRPRFVKQALGYALALGLSKTTEYFSGCLLVAVPTVLQYSYSCRHNTQ